MDGEEENRPTSRVMVNDRGEIVALACPACATSQSMQKRNGFQFGTMTAIIGVMMVIIGVIGSIFSAVIFYGTGAAFSDFAAGDAGGFAVLAGIVPGIVASIGLAASLMGIALGSFLRSPRNVWQCKYCEHVIERA